MREHRMLLHPLNFDLRFGPALAAICCPLSLPERKEKGNVSETERRLSFPKGDRFLGSGEQPDQGA
jgi:hypothetical protein